MLRAIAVATDTSDLVGTVDLSCEADGLRLSFVRAAAYASSYVPTVPASGRRALVPYEAIREVWDDGETLRLLLEAPKVPYRRLVLAHFTRDHGIDHRKLHRTRLGFQAAVAGGAALAVALLSAITREVAPAWGSLGGAVVTFGAVAAAVVGAQAAGRRVMLGGEGSAAERRAFFSDLRSRLPRAKIVDDAAPLSLGPGGGEGAGGGAGLVPDGSGDTGPSRLGELAPTLLAVAASAAVALLSVFAGTKMLSADAPVSDDPRQPQPPPSAQPASAAFAAPSATGPAVVEEPLEACLCGEPSSPALPTKVPRVSLLPRVERRSGDERRPTLAVEVAAVNNGSEPLRELQGQVQFLVSGRQAGEGPRVRAERGIYYEGPLAPGAAIKWRVSGRGTSYRLVGPAEETLDGGSLAPADAFAKLLSARTRSVRVHGATMLAKMRDERAAAAIEKLREDARDDEQIRLAQLARASAPFYACEIEATPGEGGEVGVSACVMNTSDEEAGPFDAVLAVTAQGEGKEAQELLAASPLRRRFMVPAKAGVRVTGVADAGRAAGKQASFEVQVEPARLRRRACMGRRAGPRGRG